jgi:iron complex transport system permease protein
VVVVAPQRRRVPGAVLLSAAALALLVCALLSLFVGARIIAPATTVDALFAFDGSRDHLIIRPSAPRSRSPVRSCRA